MVVPIAIGGALFIVAMIGGYLFIVPRLATWIAGWGVPSFISGMASFLLFATIWLVFSGAVFTALVGSVSPFLWDRLSLRIEEKVLGIPPDHTPSTIVVIGDGVARVVMSVVIAVVAVLLSCFTFGFIGILAAGLIGLFDFTAPAFLRRGMLLGDQARVMFRARGWSSYALGCGVISSIPIINVISLPALVAGGTLLCIEHHATGASAASTRLN